MNMKKGVSPLIAVVLLIVFTVAVSTMIMSWMNTYTKDTTTSATGNTNLVIDCAKQIIKIPTTGVTANANGDITVIIENNGQMTTNVKKIVAYENSTGIQCIIFNATTQTLDVGDFKSFGPINCTAQAGFTTPPVIKNVRATTTCGGIYDEWTNSAI